MESKAGFFSWLNWDWLSSCSMFQISGRGLCQTLPAKKRKANSLESCWILELFLQKEVPKHEIWPSISYIEDT